MEGNKKKDEEVTSSFGVEMDGGSSTQIPSVSKLLNRKSLNISKSSEPTATVVIESETSQKPPQTGSTGLVASAPPPGSAQAKKDQSPSLPAPSSQAQSPGPSAKVQPASVKIRPKENKQPSHLAKLHIWNLALLQTTQDPLGKALCEVFSKGIQSALFLSITPPPPGAILPHFEATAAIQPGQKVGLWTGLRWDPTVVPELWNFFVRAGLVELPPPGTVTYQQSNRNIVRTAFGLQNSEWIMLVRVGSTKECRGVMALISQKSLIQEIQTSLPVFFAQGVEAPHPTEKKAS